MKPFIRATSQTEVNANWTRKERSEECVVRGFRGTLTSLVAVKSDQIRRNHAEICLKFPICLFWAKLRAKYAETLLTDKVITVLLQPRSCAK